ncbi:MAG: TonB-dependent receptor domain-containing protein, partial [Terriglobia bacterium]
MPVNKFSGNTSRWLLQIIPVALCMALILCFSQNVRAQADEGAITGTVKDSAGGAMAQATVTLTNLDTGLQFKRETDASGVYIFTPVKIGRYKVSATATGFETTVQGPVQVNVNERVGIDLTLRPGSVQQTVTVSAVPLLQTESGSTGQVFSTQVINDTPLDGRNYVYIAQLAPGVAPPNSNAPGVSQGSGDFTANGQRSWQNNFILDGVDNNSSLQDFLNGATYVLRPPPDALSEFKVQTSDYSAELGHSAGAVVNASIKSGTNQIHGSLWEYFRNNALDARDFFEANVPGYHQNQFGGTLGGPFLKNKLFFFADAQATRISYALDPQIETVPTAAMVNGDFTQMLNPALTLGNGAIHLYQPGGNTLASVGGPEIGPPNYLTCNGAQNVICANQIDTVAQKILGLYPKPNTGVPGQVFNNYLFSGNATDDTTQWDARLDWNVSEKDQAFARYSYSQRPQFFPQPLGPILDGGGFGTSGQDGNEGKNFVLSETHFLGPSISNEFRFGFNWIRATYLQTNSGVNLSQQLGLGGIPFYPENGGLPDIGFGGYINGLGSPSYEPSDERENVYQILDNVTKVWGNHTVKFGVNFQHVRFYGLQPPNSLGFENFDSRFTSDPTNNTQVTGSGVADFLLNLMDNSGITSFSQFTDVRWYRAAFIQDDWKVTQKLTLNLGLRYEYAQPNMERYDHQSNFVGTYANNGQGTGVFLLPESAKSYPLPPALAQAFATDHVQVQYTPNRFLVSPDQTNFAPRIGFAYRLTDKTVVRGGFGIFYGGLENLGLGPNLGSNAPFNVSANFSPTNGGTCQNVLGVVDCSTNGQTLETGFSAALATPGGLINFANLPTIFASQSNAQTPYSEAYNLTVERALTPNTSFQISYVGNVDRHLQESYNANTYAGNRVIGQPNPQSLEPFPDLGTVEPIVDQGVSSYNSLQASLQHRYSKGLTFLASYTWAHCLDDAFGTIGQSEYGGYRNPNLLGFGYDYGDCTQDVRNRFTLNTQYELPFGQGKRFMNRTGVLNQVAGGWKASVLFIAQTGEPVFLNANNGTGGYPIEVADPFKPGGTPQFGTSEVCAAQTRTVQSWYNPCAFANPPRATFGATDPSQNRINVDQAGLLTWGPEGRVAVYGPGYNKIDISMFKDFKLTFFHESDLQFRADIFNLFNTPSFGYPNNSLGGSAASEIFTTRFS